MRILHTIQGYPPEGRAGVETYTRHLCGRLKDRHEVFVFSRSADKTKKEYEVTDESVDGVSVRRVVNNFLDVDRFERYYINDGIEALFEDYLDTVKPDIVHVQHLVGLSASLVHVVRKRGIPLVLTLHDYWYICPRVQLLDAMGEVCSGPRQGNRCTRVCSARFWTPPGAITRSFAWKFLKKMTPQAVQRFIKYELMGAPQKKPVYVEYEQRKPVSVTDRAVVPEDEFNSELVKYMARTLYMRDALAQADVVVAPSRFVAGKYLEFGVEPERLRVIYHGMEADRLSGIERRPSGKLRFGYLGTLLAHKGIDVLIDAFNTLPPGRAELYIHGYGDEDEAGFVAGLKRRVKAEGVRFMGGYGQDELPGILAGLDVVVVPSVWYETFNIVAREALISGAPVIVSNIGALPEAVTDGLNGFLFRPGDARDLAGKMARLIEEPGLLDAMRNAPAGLKDMEAHAVEMEAIYAGLAARGRQ